MSGVFTRMIGVAAVVGMGLGTVPAWGQVAPPPNCQQMAKGDEQVVLWKAEIGKKAGKVTSLVGLGLSGGVEQIRFLVDLSPDLVQYTFLSPQGEFKPTIALENQITLLINGGASRAEAADIRESIYKMIQGLAPGNKDICPVNIHFNAAGEIVCMADCHETN